MEFKNNKGQFIGTHINQIFRRVVDKDRHLMRKYNAWGIQYNILEQLRKEDCLEIRIKEKVEQKIYTVGFDKFMNEAVVEDYGDGMQAFLPLDKWKVREVEK
jgi:hypothetical protein